MRVEDGDVHREVYGGDDAAATVVLVHGAGGTHVVWWQHLVPRCEAAFRVVALDLPGRRYVGRALWDAAAADALRAEHVVLAGCGHSPYFEDAPAWNAAAIAWLENPSSPA